jgi:hypothetical protein
MQSTSVETEALARAGSRSIVDRASIIVFDIVPGRPSAKFVHEAFPLRWVNDKCGAALRTCYRQFAYD